MYRIFAIPLLLLALACQPDVGGTTEDSTVGNVPPVAPQPTSPTTSTPSPSPAPNPEPSGGGSSGGTTQPPPPPPPPPPQPANCDLGGLLNLGFCAEALCFDAADLIGCIGQQCDGELAALGQPCVNCLQNLANDLAAGGDFDLGLVLSQCTD